MTNKNCYGCSMFITNVELRQLNRRFGDEVYPLDVEWKNCLQGEDAYLNCRKRIEEKKVLSRTLMKECGCYPPDKLKKEA